MFYTIAYYILNGTVGYTYYTAKFVLTSLIEYKVNSNLEEKINKQKESIAKLEIDINELKDPTLGFEIIDYSDCKK